MPSASLHIEGNPLLIINEFPRHWLLINLLFYSSNYFCLFQLTVSFPHLPWASHRRCCLANVTFLCSQVPYSLCSVHGHWDPSWYFLRHKPASHMEWLASPRACISPKLWYMQLQAPKLGLAEGTSRECGLPISTCFVPLGSSQELQGILIIAVKRL